MSETVQEVLRAAADRLEKADVHYKGAGTARMDDDSTACVMTAIGEECRLLAREELINPAADCFAESVGLRVTPRGAGWEIVQWNDSEVVTQELAVKEMRKAADALHGDD